MNRRSLLCLTWLGAACACLPPARSHAQTAPPVDPAAILATLKEIKTKQPAVINRERAGVLAAINAAAADPAKAYEQAVMAVNIQGSGGSEGGKTVEWRKDNAALLHNAGFLEGVRLYLNYLALTWQHATGVKAKDQLGPLMEHAAQVSNALEKQPALAEELRKRDSELKKSLGESIFTAYFQVRPYLAKSEDWADQPFDTEGIYQKAILPTLRAQKDPRLLGYWNNRLLSEAAHANASQNSLAVNRSNNVVRPALFWSRAEDELLLGQTNQAVADMMAQIKGHPDHPDFDHWVSRVTEIVSPPKGEVTVGPATPGDAAPAPTAKP